MKTFTLLLLSSLTISCGTMKVTSRKYFSITNGEDVNYYRLRIKGKSVLGDAQFKSGWYPTESVDLLFGNVSPDNKSNYKQTKEEIEAEINKKVKKAYVQYLKEASDPDAKKERLMRLLEARRRVLAAPTKYPPFDHSYIIEYDVSKGTAIAHADEKLVYILSSNPDEVIAKITNFAESEETANTISKLSKTLSTQKTREVSSKSLSTQKRDTTILRQLDITLDQLTASNPDESSQELQLSILLNLLEE